MSDEKLYEEGYLRTRVVAAKADDRLVKILALCMRAYPPSPENHYLLGVSDAWGEEEERRFYPSPQV